MTNYIANDTDANKHDLDLFPAHFAEAITRLQIEPERWVFSAYTATHLYADIEIWHANRFYGVSLRVGTAKYKDKRPSLSLSWWRSSWRQRLCFEVDKASDVMRLQRAGARAK